VFNELQDKQNCLFLPSNTTIYLVSVFLILMAVSFCNSDRHLAILHCMYLKLGFCKMVR